MIPQRLILKDFLSYREATLDFHGLHVACVCGENGAGKSSLLEAIAWAVWGQSRAASEQDVVHLGAEEARVDFTFQLWQHTYRIIRTRHRSQSGSLEFQVKTPEGFRSLTGKGVRATQSLILQYVKLDYDTFVNSAYLRQGRADEFMLKRPSERKQILADLLKLDQYDGLAEQSRERSRQFKAEIAVLERNLQQMDEQLQQEDHLKGAKDQLEQQLTELQRCQEQDAEALQQAQENQQQRRSLQQDLQIQQQQQQHLQQDAERLQQELSASRQQLADVNEVIGQAEAIAQGYAYLHQLQAEDDDQTRRFQLYQALQVERQEAVEQQAEHLNRLRGDRQQVQAQKEALEQQMQEISDILSHADEVQTGVATLHRAKERLAHLDQLQLEAVPLLQRRQQVQAELDWTQAQLTARLEALKQSIHQLATQQSQHDQLQTAVTHVASQIDYLEKRRAYQQEVREKGLERRSFMERLQADQRIYETQLAELEHKLNLLKQQGDRWPRSAHADALYPPLQVSMLDLLNNSSSNHSSGTIQRSPTPNPISTPSPQSSPEAYAVMQSQVPALAESNSSYSAEFPPCPLCDRPLDEEHWRVVVERHQGDHKQILEKLWVVREQLAVAEREIQVLRDEYRNLEKELANYGTTLELRGQLQAQLHGVVDAQTQRQQLETTCAELERSLQHRDYSPELQEELRLLDHRLAQLQYDERNHALARGEVDRWRWAEIKQAEIHQARRRQQQWVERLPQLEQAIALCDQQLHVLHHSPLQQQINALDQQISEIAYDVEQHKTLRDALRQAQSWQIRYQELLRAQDRVPELHHRIQTQELELQTVQQHQQSLHQQVEALQQQMKALPDRSQEIQQRSQTLQQRRSQLDQYLSELGQLQQQHHYLQQLHEQRHHQADQLQSLRRHYRVYSELTQAFGKNGIQALMIENVLPQLEAATNQILGRLSAHQLHVQFVTQRSSKRSSKNAKLIDTLDILISDVQGTRPYETYSGGEAFRVNFAIRLALARLLAQQSGATLQMLIIDEGFGTQDEAGCSRLVSAIQAIATDFACILAVTHIPHLKAAFQTRIEVNKTAHGSHLQVVA